MKSPGFVQPFPGNVSLFRCDRIRQQNIEIACVMYVYYVHRTVAYLYKCKYRRNNTFKSIDIGLPFEAFVITQNCRSERP